MNYFHLGKLQEKYNDWCDSGGNPVDFYANNGFLGGERKITRQELEHDYRILKEKRQIDPNERIKIIRKRLENYQKHQNDPYAYFQGEIKEVRTLLHHAPEDIEFLLNELKRPKKETPHRTSLTSLQLHFFQNDYNKFRDAGGAHERFVEVTKLSPKDGETLRKNYESRKAKITKT